MRLLRYYSNWVLVFNGVATSWFRHIVVFSAGLIVLLTMDVLLVLVYGTIQPALANSAS